MTSERPWYCSCESDVSWWGVCLIPALLAWAAWEALRAMVR